MSRARRVIVDLTKGTGRLDEIAEAILVEFGGPTGLARMYCAMMHEARAQDPAKAAATMTRLLGFIRSVEEQHQRRDYTMLTDEELYDEVKRLRQEIDGAGGGSGEEEEGGD